MPTPQTSAPDANKPPTLAPSDSLLTDNPNPITDPAVELRVVLEAARPLVSALISRGTLNRLTVEQLIDLSISLAREQGRKDTEDKLTNRIYELEATIATLQRELGRYRPPLAWYMTNNAIWIHNPDNPGRPTVIARMGHTGVMLVHSRAVWNWLKTILPAPPRLEELRKLHGDDYPPTGSLPVATSTPKPDTPISAKLARKKAARRERDNGETA